MRITRIIRCLIFVAPAAAKHLSFPFQVNLKSYDEEVPIPPPHVDFKKYKAVNKPLYNQDFFYTMNISVGTPPQPFELILDTGSSDLWVMDESNPYCLGNGEEDSTITHQFNCTDAGGTFSPSLSSTYVYNNSDFYILYGDSSMAKGDYGEDTVTLEDGTEVPNVGIGVGKVTNSSIGVLGIGLPDNEASNYLGNKSFSYDNFPIALREAGLIDRITYSLYLPQHGTGDILFSGIDRSKFVGGLWTLPLTDNNTLSVANTKISASNGYCKDSEIVSNTSINALLDSGTTLTFLPNAIVQKIAHIYNATYRTDVGAYTLECNAGEDDSRYLSYFFGEAEIRVPIRQTFYDASEVAGHPVLGPRGDPLCILGFTGIGSNHEAIFGNSFLRSAYVVYDLENREISLAQANFEADREDQDVVDVVDTVPGALPASLFTPFETATVICATVTETATKTVLTRDATTTVFSTDIQETATLTSFLTESRETTLLTREGISLNHYGRRRNMF